MVGCAKGGWGGGFTVQHNIRIVCVGTASGGSTLRTCLPLRRSTRHPPRRASSASDWSTLFKMASSPHKIRFISIPWKGGPCSYVLSTPDFGKNLSETGTVPLFHPFSPLLRRPLFESRPPARPPPRSFNGRRSSILTLKGVPTFGPAFHGQHFPE